MAFQWGLGNDALLPSIAATALDRVDDGETWGSAAGAVFAAAVAGFAFWAATQLIDVLVVMCGLGLIPGITARLSGFVRRKGWVKPYDELAWTTRWAVAYLAGASVLCLVDVLATGRRGVRSRVPIVATAIGFSAGTIALIIGLTATAAMVGTRIPTLEPGARVFIDYAKNPLTWITLFASILGIGYLRGRLRERRRSRPQGRRPRSFTD